MRTKSYNLADDRDPWRIFSPGPKRSLLAVERDLAGSQRRNGQIMESVVNVSCVRAAVMVLWSAMTGYSAQVQDDVPRATIDHAAEDAGLPAGITPEVLTWRRAYMQRIHRTHERAEQPRKEL